MLVKIGGRKVEVVDQACAKRECFVLGFDKGSFAQGRGYSYRRDAKGRVVERPVCATRHHRGCPTNSVCEACRTVSVEAPGGKCSKRQCGGALVEMAKA